MPMISDKEYDLVISFLTPHYFGLEKCKGKKRIAWIHTDYSMLDVDEKSESRMWGGYDEIVSISDDVSAAFIKRFPSLENKLVRVDNIISQKSIVEYSKAERNGIVNDGKTVILSCGRVTEGKNFAAIPKMCSYILSRGHDIVWYIVGDGPDADRVRANVISEKMADRVIMLGAKTNPYPYIAACDLYVQPSFYEGKAVAVREAQILGKPVVITDYPTAKSQLTDGFDGIIAPLDSERCAEVIASLLSDKNKLAQLRENCLSQNYSTENEIKKICDLIN
jgi:glycosyltransferase involved in cell wall biosynthesis